VQFLRRFTGYVEQFDTLLGILTVEVRVPLRSSAWYFALADVHFRLSALSRHPQSSSLFLLCIPELNFLFAPFSASPHLLPLCQCHLHLYLHLYLYRRRC
jgi:hypothetical protein